MARRRRDQTGQRRIDFGPPTMQEAIEGGELGMARVEENAGEPFAVRARQFVINYLRRHGASPGEDITDACKQEGIRPHDDRAFGPVYNKLSRDGIIEKCGEAKRRKGHGTTGGNVWKLIEAQT